MKRKTENRIMFLGSLITCLCLFIFNPLPTKAQNKTLTIGQNLPLSGMASEFGRLQKLGTDLAVEEINSKGGVKGFKFQIKREDDKFDVKEAVTIAKKFVDDKEIVINLGNIRTPQALAAAPIHERGRLPLLISWASNPEIHKQGKYIFQNCLTMEDEPPAAARYAINNLGVKNIALIYMNDDWGTDVRDRFTKAVEQLGGKVVSNEASKPGEIDFRNALLNIVSRKPEALYLALAATDAGQVLRQVKELNVTFPIYGSSAIGTKALIDLGGSAAEGTVVLSGFNEGDPDPVIQQFSNNFMAKFNEVASGWSVYPYDSIYLIAEAIKTINGDVNRDSLRDALDNLKNVRLVVGTVSSVDRYFGPRKVVATIVKGNSFKFYQNIK